MSYKLVQMVGLLTVLKLKLRFYVKTDLNRNCGFFSTPDTVWDCKSTALTEVRLWTHQASCSSLVMYEKIYIMQWYTNDERSGRHHCVTPRCKHTPSNCSSLRVNVRNVVYLHKQCYRSAWCRQQVAVKCQLRIVTCCQSFSVKCFTLILGDVWKDIHYAVDDERNHQ